MQTPRTPGMVSKQILIRDFALLLFKLVVDGLKDVLVIKLAIIAVVLDLVFPGTQRGRLFYGLMRLAERFDLWLNLYGSARRAGSNDDGLFEVSRAGANTMLGKLEKVLEQMGMETGEAGSGAGTRRP